jgi:cytochrome c peroxidase
MNRLSFPSLVASLGFVSVLLTAIPAGDVLAAGAAKPSPLAPLGDPPIPPDNKQTKAKIELGKILFFDPRLGGDASVSCASCHDPEQGWAFAEDISRGYPGSVHWRNSQTIVNSAYLGKLFWAGSAGSLEKQAPSAAKGAVAGNGENDIMEARLALIPEYRKRFKEVFGDTWPLIDNAWRAIASFERTMVQKDAPIDKYLKGDKAALTAQQLAGMKLFNGKANCIACHNGALASDQAYYNIGVPPNKRWEEDGLAQITFRYELYAKGVTEEMYRKTKADPGFYFRSKNKWDIGKFRTPSLRYTMYTAPYMHNGAFYTLEEVVDFYNKGGVDEEGRTTDFPQTKSKLIKPLGLTDKEKEDLLAFLEAFSGDEIKMDKPKLPEYAPLFTEAQLLLEVK